LGICLSGAGPTILALVSKEDARADKQATSSSTAGTISTDDSEITLGGDDSSTTDASAAAAAAAARMQAVGEAIKALWKEEGIEVEWLALEIDREGATLREL
jgi:homoserine kinase